MHVYINGTRLPFTDFIETYDFKKAKKEITKRFLKIYRPLLNIPKKVYFADGALRLENGDILYNAEINQIALDIDELKSMRKIHSGY